jgi:hypothetical protein
MNEDEFDAWMNLRGPRRFGIADAARLEAEQRAKTRLVMTLGEALWGKTAADAERQLQAPHPEIPAGFDLADFHALLAFTAQLNTSVVTLEKLRGVPPVGNKSLTLWAARHEIVRRALDYLERG